LKYFIAFANASGTLRERPYTPLAISYFRLKVRLSKLRAIFARFPATLALTKPINYQNLKLSAKLSKQRATSGGIKHGIKAAKVA
ncbi:MAG TPA: hypothetical protein DD990_04960, partial [Cyanobacteria bacterium UBA11368]|nr:hypothetical protein [Cyanobacteria bacterium UBA11368]